MKHRDNNVTYGIQKEFDTYTKFVLEFIVSNILANISAENERRPEVIYMDDLFLEPFYEGIPTNVDKEYVKGRGEIYFIDNEYLAKALKKLNKKDREIILMYYFAGFRSNEIADIVGLSVDVVYNRKSRALKHLKKFILEEMKNAEKS